MMVISSVLSSDGRIDRGGGNTLKVGQGIMRELKKNKLKRNKDVTACIRKITEMSSTNTYPNIIQKAKTEMG